MKLKKDRKINQKILSFLKLKPGFKSAKTILSKSDFDRDARRRIGKRVVILNFRHVILNLIQSLPRARSGDLKKVLVSPARLIRFRIKSGMTRKKAVQGLALKISAGFKNFSIKIYLKTCLPVGKVTNYKIKNFLRGIKGVMGNKVYLRKAFAALTIIAVIVTAYLQNTPQASAATFTL
jgi:hypothetical protein